MKRCLATLTAITLCICSLVAPAQPASAQSVYANLWATKLWSTANFPFPTNFAADHVIALYDTNGDGIINSYPADPTTVFPFVYTGFSTTLGSRIGWPYVIGDTNFTFEPFCGHILVYAEAVQQQTTYFMWFAFPDPNRPRPASCDAWAVDFGVGSYSGSSDVRQATNIHHASYVGSYLYGPGGYGDIGLGWSTPGSLASPGELLSRHPTDPTRPMPRPLSFIQAVEPAVGALGLPEAISLANVIIDVPFVAEEQWDGQTLFPTDPSVARTIQSLGQNSQSFSTTGGFASLTTVWSSQYGNANNWQSSPTYWQTIRFPDLNGDGKADVCGRGYAGLVCALSNGQAFGTATVWSTEHSDANGWQNDPSAWSTIQFADLNNDRKADVCGRATGGIYCALSTGSAFATASYWSSHYSNANGWQSDPAYWQTIRFPDLNADGRADLCGRGYAGLVCALSNGRAFGTVTVWSTDYSNANGWQNDPSAWSTIQFADLNNDRKADVCGRAINGIYCALSTGSAFAAGSYWSSQYSNANNWHSSPTYWQTIQFADLNNDRKADVCGRGYAGLVCALSNGQTFGTATVWSTQHSDANGWQNDPSAWSTIQFADLNNDRKADVCGRAINGIYCALSTGSAFAAGSYWSSQYSNANNWHSSPTYWQTIRFPDLNADGRADVCGRGYAGQVCALSTGQTFNLTGQ